MKPIRDLKRGEYFTLKPIDFPNETQVYVRGNYDRSEKKYECCKFSDFCCYRYFKGDKLVYTDFTF